MQSITAAREAFLASDTSPARLNQPGLPQGDRRLAVQKARNQDQEARSKQWQGRRRIPQPEETSQIPEEAQTDSNEDDAPEERIHLQFEDKLECM